MPYCNSYWWTQTQDLQIGLRQTRDIIEPYPWGNLNDYQ